MSEEDKVTVPLSRAKKAECEQYAALHGIDLGDCKNVGEMRDTISLTLNGAGSFELPAASGDARDEGNAEPEYEGDPADRLHYLTIHKSEELKGRKVKDLSVNGKAIVVPIGQKVKIAYKYILVLENAIQTTYWTDEEDETIVHSETGPRIPFTDHGPVPDSELDD